jgi:tight adherence protein B
MSSTLTAPYLYGGLAALGVGLVVLLALLVPRKERELTMEDRAATYTDRLAGRHSSAGGTGDSEPAMQQAKDAAAKVLSNNQALNQRIAQRLAGAGSEMKPAEWLLLHLAIFLVSGVVGLLLGSAPLGVIFLALGAFLPWFYLGFRRNRRFKKFESLLPDTLQLMSGSLAAGLSLAQSVDTIVREGQEPVSSEFRRVLVETRLGVSLEDAFDGVAERFQSKDFAWVVMAIRIQRQVGGNLGELLNTVADTMREREYMRRQVAALAAEGKLSAAVLGGLPPAFLCYLLVARRDYVMVLFTDPRGWLALGTMAVMLSVGIFWMSKLVKVEV